MTLSLSPVSLVNVALCIIILALGCLCYKKNQNKEALYIGIAFGLFGISHILTMLGLAENMGTILVAIRTLAYVIVAFSLYKKATRK